VSDLGQRTLQSNLGGSVSCLRWEGYKTEWKDNGVGDVTMRWRKETDAPMLWEYLSK